MNKSLSKILAAALSITLFVTGTIASFAANEPLTTEPKIEVVSGDKDGAISKVTSSDGTITYVATKEIKVDNNYDATSEEQIITTLSDDVKNKILNSQTKDNSKNEKRQATRINFGFANSLENAKNILSDINLSETNKNSEISAMSRGYFWHGSYVEDYWGYAGHGYHIKLAPVDVSYITNMGWVVLDSFVGVLAALGLISGGWAAAIGFIVVAAVLTVAWRETNGDGTMDIWSPDAFRSFVKGSSLVQVGSHWYWF